MGIEHLNRNFVQAVEVKALPLKDYDDQVQSFLCIGAVPDATDEEHGLAINDFYIYRDVLNTIVTAWHVPAAKAFEKTIVNIDPTYGGLDFLGMSEKDIQADVLILHNIPKETDQVNKTLTHGERDVLGTSVMKQACSAFVSSEHHHSLANWRAQIAASGAKIVFVYGADSFEADDLLTDNYIALPYKLQCNGLKQAVLVDKYYLGRIANSPDIETKFNDFAEDHGFYGSKPVRALIPA